MIHLNSHRRALDHPLPALDHPVHALDHPLHVLDHPLHALAHHDDGDAGDDPDVPVPFKARGVDLASHPGLRLPQPLH